MRYRLYRFRTETIVRGTDDQPLWVVEFSKVRGEGPNKAVVKMSMQQHATVAVKLSERKRTWTDKEIDGLPQLLGGS